MIKPAYRVPLMTEIRQIPHNGLNVVSAFAGCGGSSTGYRMSGYRVLAAVEFVPAAADSYQANKADYTQLLRRDVRQIRAAEILDAVGLKAGELDVFDGSPPCEPFSTAGRRDKTWDRLNEYSGQVQRTDDLFFEYARLVKGLRPRVFVAENVTGLVRGRAKGYFIRIMAALRACGYRVSSRVLNAAWLGVPQSRQRVIIIGVRADEIGDPVFPEPLSYQYTVRDALPHILRVGTDPPFDQRRRDKMTVDDMMVSSDRVSPCVQASMGAVGTSPGASGVAGLVESLADPTVGRGAQNASHYQIENPERQRRQFTIPELKRICGFPDDYILTGSFSHQWERLGDSVPPPMAAAWARTLADQHFNQQP